MEGELQISKGRVRRKALQERNGTLEKPRTRLDLKEARIEEDWHYH